MEQSEVADDKQEIQEPVAVSSGEESAPNPIIEAADPVGLSVTATVPDTPVTCSPVTCQAVPEINDTAVTSISSSPPDDTPDASGKEDEIKCSDLTENTVNSPSKSNVETPEITPSLNLSQEQKCDINEEIKIKKKEDNKPAELGDAQVDGTVTSSGKEDSPKKEADSEITNNPATNEDCTPSDGILVIDEGEAPSHSSSPNDLEPQLNEKTGAFEIPQKSSSGEIITADTRVEPSSEMVEVSAVPKIILETLAEKEIGVAADTNSTTGTDNAVSEEQEDPKKKMRSSIEDSIERCIAYYTSHSPPNSPHNKTKFPQNFGFKIITNKINLSNSINRVLTPPSKSNQEDQDDETPPAKKIKSKTKKIANKPAVKLVRSISTTNSPEKNKTDKKSNTQNASKIQQPVTKQTKNLKANVNKCTGELQKGKNTPKERPISCLKVRDVESINATIPIKTPVCEVTPEDGQGKEVQLISYEKNFNNDELSHSGNVVTESMDEGTLDLEAETSQVLNTLNTKPSPPSVVLRPIAPKCEPIANNDSHSVKLLRDLIQLPSIAVYVPDDSVSHSKHFNGRLHMCHGCGDRFVLLKSLLEHQNRRSCVIKFQCFKCASSVLCFFNRCEFIRHLYNHNQTLTNTMLQFHIVVERLPSNASNVVFDVKTCHECKLFLKIPLIEHMQGADQTEKKPDLALKCQWCSLMLPTKCAYQAHRRMHFLQAPLVCPECGNSCSDGVSFNTHINSICYHTSKRSLFHCSSCKIEMFDARKLERHIRNKHIRDVFKCNYCFVACFTPDDLDKHRQQHHGELVAEEPESFDETNLKYAFHLCDMCPNRLIRRVRLGQHVWDHTYSANEVKYVYECRKCKVTFTSKEALAFHSSSCTATAPVSTPLSSAITPNGPTDTVVPVPQSIDYSVDGSETTAIIGDGGDITEELTPTPENEQIIDEIDAPPPLTRAPIPKPVSVVAPPTNAIQNKEKATNLISVRPDCVMLDQPREVPDFEDDLSPEMDPLSAELEGGMEVALQCLDCGANLTSELGSYCTSCEQKREAGADGFPAATITTLLAVEKKGTTAVKLHLPEGKTANAARKPFSPPRNRAKPTIGKKNANKKGGPGMFTCRICNVVITQTFDKAAMKRHFIAKHKEMFIAALQTGMEAGMLMHKSNVEDSPTQNQGEAPSEPIESPAQKEKEPAVKTSFLKRPSLRSPTKISPKKKKKQKKVSQTQNWNDSDTEDDLLLSRLSSKEMKKTKDKRKKSYSPPPVLDAAASGEVVMEQVGDLRSCYKCSFQSINKTVFMTHVATHKTNPKDMQCPACGTCFVVRPSLEKHLLIFHGMKNVDEYLADHGFPPVERDTPAVESEAVDENRCKVCHLKFDTEALLEKHFRTHGSAFLLSNKFRRS